MPKQPKKSGKHPNVALKYTGMAFQMALIIGVGVFIGKQLDSYWEFEKAIMTAVCALIALALAFYLILKDVSRQ